MPNWCSNVVTFSHSNPDAVKRIVDAWRTGEFMQQFVPCPQDLINAVKGFNSDPVEQAKINATMAANSAKYGYPTWYEWSIANWGTKWDIGEKDQELDYKLGDSEVTIRFDSAWNPPLAFYSKMIELGYNIKAYYYEPGMCFCGFWYNGVDTSYKIPGHSSEVAGVIPADIDEAFDISNTMAEWEE